MSLKLIRSLNNSECFFFHNSECHRCDDFIYENVCFLSEVTLFSPFQITDKVLLRILRHPDVIEELKFNENDKRSPQHFIYQRGKPVDYFILILQVLNLQIHTHTPCTLIMNLNMNYTVGNRFCFTEASGAENTISKTSLHSLRLH